MKNQHKPLDLGFPFGRRFSHLIVKRDHDLIAILGEFGGKLSVRHPRSKLTLLVHKFAEASPLIFHPSFEMQENADKANKILDECFKILDDLFKTFNDSQILHFWQYYTTIRAEKMLQHYYEWLLRLQMSVYQVKNDSKMEFNWEMIRLKYNLKEKLMPKVDVVHFIINYMMILMRDKWNVFKMFKQYHYCLSACQKLLDGIPESKEGLIKIQQYLHFAWVFYVGRLLDYSNQIRYVSFIPDNCCITFDTEIAGPEPRFVLPNQPLTSKDDLMTLYDNLQILEDDIIYWGNLRICGTLAALDVLESVKKYAREMEF